ncbi:MAG: hypothetical protein ACRDPO_21830 [Streptosporangiaceae bacterium]
MMICGREEAELLLTEYAAVVRSRDERVRLAVASGLSKHRVHVLSGLGRMTIERILDSAPDGPVPAHGTGETP